MSKIYAVARALAILLAIIAAFVTVPMAAPLLLILGAVSAIGNNAEQNGRVYVITIVLLVGAKSLEVIPTVGPYLASIFGGLGLALVGVSMMGIAMGVVARVKGDWMK